MLQIQTKGMFGNNLYWPYKTRYLLEVKDKSQAKSRREGRKLGRQNTHMPVMLVSNYYFRESDVEGNTGYGRKFGFEEENAYKGRTWPYRPDFVRALEEVGCTETAHLKGVC